MKSIVKTLLAASLSIAAVSACSEEKLAPSTTGTKTTVHFGAVSSIVDNATKATLTSDENELTFTGAWEGTDKIGIYYDAQDNTNTGKAEGTWNGTEKSFDVTGNNIPSDKMPWRYTAVYPVPATDGTTEFGPDRVQNGNNFNSHYDLMTATASTANSEFGKDDEGNRVIFNMDRQTAIAYFHIKSDLPETEKVLKATLSVEGDPISCNSDMNPDAGDDYNNGYSIVADVNHITITFEDGTNPSADDFKLWFNVAPSEENGYTKLTLDIETTSHTATITNTKDGTYEAGHLYKVSGTLSADKWVSEPDIEFFYESFDKCAGKGGNDDKWSGSIATNEIKSTNADNNEWAFENCYVANQCIKLGTGSKKGNATTPALGITTAKATLSFKAGSWAGDTGKTVNISVIGNGSVTPSSVTLANAKWTEYECTITGADKDTKIKFEASIANKNRFFLDEVCVYSGKKPIKKNVQNISFAELSNNTLELYIDDVDFTEPALSGAKTTVTYSSSNESVASIDAATGKLTLLSEGETTITATAEETDTYKPASASYTLKVSLRTQTLSFEGRSYSVILKDKDTFVSPKVSGAQTDVTYSISLADGTAENAILIDAKTGELTINAIGQATITATAVSSAVYKEAFASYLLVVKEEAGEETKTDKNAKIIFGANNIKIDEANVTANDSEKNSWSITTAGTTSFTANNDFYQVGSSKNPASSITFTTTLPEDAEVTAIEAKFGGFSRTSGDISLKIGDTSIGSGKLDAATDVIVKNTSVTDGNEVTITITNISKGVKCYYIQVDYKTAN